MPYDTFNQVKTLLEQRADEPTDGTSDFDGLISDLVIEIWRDLYVAHPWLALQAYPPQAVLIAAALTTLTLTVAAGSQAATLSAAPSQDVTNWWVIPSGTTYYFRITAGGATATPTLDVKAPAALTAKAVTIAQMEFDLLAGTGVLGNDLWTDGGGIDGKPVPLIGDEDVRYWYPGQPQTGWPPDYGARIGMTKVRLSHYDTTAHRIEIPYYQEPADPSGDATLAIPSFLRTALAEGALALLFNLKGDSREAAAQTRFDRMVSKRKEYDHLLRAGLGDRSGERRFEPYGDWGSPYS